MPDDKKQPDVTRLLHSLGVLTYSTTDAFFDAEGELRRPPRDKADLMGAINGHGFAIETKNFSVDGFRFSHWSEGQRHWAKHWCIGVAQVDYWLALFMGNAPVNAKAGKGIEPTRFWLYPYWKQLEIEQLLLPRVSLPYSEDSTHQLRVKALGLSAVTLLAHYEIRRYTDHPRQNYNPVLPLQSPWRLPLMHPFFQKYIARTVPMYLVESEVDDHSNPILSAAEAAATLSNQRLQAVLDGKRTEVRRAVPLRGSLHDLFPRIDIGSPGTGPTSGETE